MANLDEFLTDLTQTTIPTLDTEAKSQFGPFKTSILPIPHSIPLSFNTQISIEEPTQTTRMLLGLMKRRNEFLYLQAIDHAAHTVNFATMIGLSIREINLLYTQALLQGIGKAFFLNLAMAPRSLTADENKDLQKHSILSFLILRKFDYPEILAYGALYHHVSYSKALGYPDPEGDIQDAVEKVAQEYGFSKFVPNVVLPTAIPHKHWQLYSIVYLTNALSAAIDFTKSYKKPLELSEVAHDFESYWTEWYNPDLREKFHQYVDWLRK